MNTRILKQAFANPAFLVAVILLGVCAVGLNGATEFLKLNFKKLPVPLARPLKELPAELGPWLQVSKDQPLSHDIEEALGTKEYVMRMYLDTRQIEAPDLVELKKVLDNLQSTEEERAIAIERVYRKHPRAILQFAVTYYTGLVDTVAHIPERCVVADGYEPRDPQTVTWETSAKPLEVRYISFEDQTGYGRVGRNVAYTFHVNGKYESSPIGVRRSLQDLFQRHGYYAKMELMTQMLERDEAEELMTDFLGYAVPEVEKSFPDWAAVTGQK